MNDPQMTRPTLDPIAVADVWPPREELGLSYAAMLAGRWTLFLEETYRTGGVVLELDSAGRLAAAYSPAPLYGNER